jgi:propionate catabolism operon transcriptional regulator
MHTKKIRIGIFASSKSLLDRINVISTQQPDQFYVSTQGLDDAIPVARDMEQNGIEVIISRRGTAHLLRENLHIPVISFPPRSLEMLVSLRSASRVGRNILLPVFRQPMGGTAILEELLDIVLVQEIYHNKVDLERIIVHARKNGCQAVVGGSITQGIAQAIGMPYFEIRTSEEDITATIENARSVAQSTREQTVATWRYRSIIDAASDGIIAMDEKGRITLINAAGRKLLHTDGQITGRPITQLIPNCPVFQVLTTQKPMNDRLNQVNGESFIFNHLPVILEDEVVGAVCTFRDIGRVMRAENVVRRSLSQGLVAKYELDDLVHESTIMRDTVNISRQYARTDSTILIIGATGTGKEIFAHGIHNLSPRVKHPFVSVNCAALPEQLLESELFGYDEGAFTGSKKGGKPGRFEIAHQGTIFLDEIDTTPEAVQIRLLRVLQEREVMRVGGAVKIPIDVRVIAAASRDLSLAVKEGKFRADLFYRLNVLRLPIPPLKQRREDIAVLLRFFIRLFSERHGLAPIALPQTYINKLQDYEWPGNVRQLRNFSERLVMNCSLRCSNDMLDILYQELVEYTPEAAAPETDKSPGVRPMGRMRKSQLNSERGIVLDALQQARYNKSRAAESLGISRTTLWRKIRELGID